MSTDKNKRSKTQWLLYFLRGSKRFFAAGLLFALLVSVIEMISPKVILFTVDVIIGGETAQLPFYLKALIALFGGLERVILEPFRIALLILLLGLLGALFRYFFRTLTARGAETYVRTMRNDLYEHILALPYSWFLSHSTGDVIQRCTSDVQTIKRFVSEQLVALIRTVILVVLGLLFMGSIDIRIMLISAAFIPVIVGYSFFFHHRIASAFERADEEEGVLSGIAQENLTGVRVVRAFGREISECERFDKKNREYTALWVRLMRILSAYWCSGDVLTALQVLVVLALGAAACVHGRITVGSYIALVSYNTMLVWPVRMLGRVIAEMSKAGISLGRVREIMESEEEKDAADAVATFPRGDIVFENVSFSYENAEIEALRDISFTIPLGSTVGILGGTGSGKSTLMLLLTRLYPLSENSGRITIGDIDIAKIRSGVLRENIGMVLQEPYLFSRTIRENIAITRGQIEEEELFDAAKIAQIHDAIRQFAKGYDTAVGERGVTLSGGQKQRTAIAQMLVKHPPVMIFDDSLSAVDAETDNRIRGNLKKGTGDSTVILISHRITTLMNADRIVVLDKGRIREIGNHRELMEQNGLYRRIYELQSKGVDDESFE